MAMAVIMLSYNGYGALQYNHFHCVYISFILFFECTDNEMLFEHFFFFFFFFYFSFHYYFFHLADIESLVKVKKKTTRLPS